MNRCIQFISILLIASSCSANAVLPPQFLPVNVKQIESGDQIEILPPMTASKGLIFYPGGLVSPNAYLPLLAPLATKGVRIVITKPFLNLAVFNPEAAISIVQSSPDLKWYIAGHSLGGAMAVKAVKKRSELFSGLALLGAYADQSDAISDKTLPVLSVSASQDGLSTPVKIDKAKVYLPAQTKYLVIEGGNHAQFGDYGVQDKDGQASIERHLQQEQTRQALIRLMFPE